MKKLIIIVLLSLLFITFGFSQNYWLGNYPNAKVTGTAGKAFLDSLADLSAAEIEILDGATVTTAELNALDNNTATYNELNALDKSLYFEYMEDFIVLTYDSVQSSSAYCTAFFQDTVEMWSTGGNIMPRGWSFAADSGFTLANAATYTGGVLKITGDADSNDEFYMQLGELGTETLIAPDSGSGRSWWADFRFATTDVTSSAANFFVGFAEEGAAAANFIADAGDDFADVDVLGFVCWEANEDTVQAVYQVNGSAFVDTFQTVVTTAQTLWSIYFDGANTITFYKNGTALGSISPTASGMPSAQEMAPIIAVKQGAQARVLDVDYIRVISERE